MKAQFSRISYRSDRHYSGVYQQQGRMITDADWNELMSVIQQRQQYANKLSMGSGVPRGGNVISDDAGEGVTGILKVEENRSSSGVVDITTTLQWGALLVDGLYAEVVARDSLPSNFDYSAQYLFPDAPALPASGNVIFYADVWERLVVSLQDESMRDSALHGADTCVRTQVMAQIKYTKTPDQIMNKLFNPAQGSGVFNLQRVPNATGKDDPCLAQSSIAKDLGNYLFRLEVHEVQGDAGSPNQLTIKWSSENAAESYLTGKETAEFKSGNWVYEFYDDSTEQSLGVHLLAADKMADVKRASLKVDADQYVIDETFKYVRRWDGYCTLTRSAETWTVDSGRHLGGTIPDDINAEFSGGKLTIYFGELNLTLECMDKTFVAGDYWFALLREIQDENSEPDVLSALPVGIVHHYLKLGTVNVAVPDKITSLTLDDVRQLSFPSLTNITADRVGYDASVVSSRWDDINDSEIQYPQTVQDAIDNLASNLEASDIKYVFSECDVSDGVPSFKNLIETSIKNKFTENGEVKVKVDDLWDAILCELDAAKVPYNPSFKRQRWADINDYLVIRNNVEQQQTYNLVESKEVFYSTVEFGISLSMVMDQANNIWVAFSWSDNNIYKTLLIKFDPLYQLINNVEYDFIIDDIVAGNESDGNIYITGIYNKSGELDLPESERDGVFLAELNSDASISWLKGFVGNINGDYDRNRNGLSIARDNVGNIIISGNVRGEINFNNEGEGITNSPENIRSNTDYIFLVKFKYNGQYISSTSFTSPSIARVYSIELDSNNNVLLAGVFKNEIKFYEQSLKNVREENDGSVIDHFMVKLNIDEEKMLWSDQFENVSEEVEIEILIDSEDNIYLADFTADRRQGSVRIIKYTPDGEEAYVQDWSNKYDIDGQLTGIDLGLDVEENIIISGSFYGAINFGGNDLISTGGTLPDDTYLASFDQDGNHRWSIKKGGEIRTDLGARVIQDNNGNILLTGMEVKWGRGEDTYGYDVDVVDLNAIVSVFTLDEESLPLTVQQAIDDLIDNLESSDIRYDLPTCGENNSVRDLLPSIKDLPESPPLKVDDILDALLCELDADTIPYESESNIGTLKDGFVNVSGDTMTGALIVDDKIGIGTGQNPSAKLAINGGVHVGGESDPGDNNLLVDGDCIIAGNLKVDGTTTTVNTQELRIEDNIMTLNRYDGNALNTNDAGIEVYRGSASKAQIIWNETDDRWEFGVEGNLVSFNEHTHSKLYTPDSTPEVALTVNTGGNISMLGGKWDVSTTEGDLKIGDENYRMKIGVATGGNGAGDVRIRAHGGTNRLILGSGTNDVLSISAGKVGIGNITPNAALDVLGGRWNLSSTEGDLKIGDDRYRMKIGVATAGGGAGDVRIRSHGGTNRIILGGSTNDVLTVRSNNVGIGTIDPVSRAKLDVRGNIYLTGKILQDAWRTPAMQNGWTAYGNPYNTPGYYLDKSGVVHLRGLIRSGVISGKKNNGTIFILPVDFRPAARELHVVAVAGESRGRCDIDADGRVRAISGNNGWFSLDGITFRAELNLSSLPPRLIDFGVTADVVLDVGVSEFGVR